MRSVVVVLPASMCAMIPMLRVFSSENVRGMRAVSGGGWSARAVRPSPWVAGDAAVGGRAPHLCMKKGPAGPVHDTDVGSGRVSRGFWSPYRLSALGASTENRVTARGDG